MRAYVLRRVFQSAIVLLIVGFSAVMLALVLGVVLGMLAGYLGGWSETVIMRVVDVQLTIPVIRVAILIFGIAKGITPPEYRDQMAIWVLILAIGLIGCAFHPRCPMATDICKKQQPEMRRIGATRVACHNAE